MAEIIDLPQHYVYQTSKTTIAICFAFILYIRYMELVTSHISTVFIAVTNYLVAVFLKWNLYIPENRGGDGGSSSMFGGGIPQSPCLDSLI